MTVQLVHHNCGGAIATLGQTVEDGTRRMVHWCRACGAHSDLFTDSTIIELDLTYPGPLSLDEVSHFVEHAPIREKAS